MKFIFKKWLCFEIFYYTQSIVLLGCEQIHNFHWFIAQKQAVIKWFLVFWIFFTNICCFNWFRVSCTETKGPVNYMVKGPISLTFLNYKQRRKSSSLYIIISLSNLSVAFPYSTTVGYPQCRPIYDLSSTALI